MVVNIGCLKRASGNGGNGKRKRKAETESWNGNRELKREMVVNAYILLLYAMIVDLIELDLSPSLINVNELIVLGKLITIIQGL